MKNETIKQTAERVCDSISAVRRQDRLPIIDKSIRQHVDPLLQQKQELRDELERLLSIGRSLARVPERWSGGA